MESDRGLKCRITAAIASTIAASNHTRTLTDLGLGWASGINARGQIVGVSLAGTDPTRFFERNGNMTELNGFGNVPSYAAAINERGEVVGSYYPKPGEAHASFGTKAE
jgi:probable HAF family extracellular repeat protein